jgi:hypothetical protein
VNKAFVIDRNKQPVAPTSPARARILLSSGKATVYRRYPFTIMLKKSVEKPVEEPLRLKIDPGSKTTGIAIVNDRSGEVVFAAEISHRGAAIKKAIESRRMTRQSRRHRHTRYRQPRWSNRRRCKGWLPPSLESRIQNILTWIQRLRDSSPIQAISLELVKFDMQAQENSEISGIEYQQGTLAGYEVREYLLLKWNHACAYCGKKNIPLQVEHIIPRARGGSNRISNLAIACEVCNRKKGTQDISEFLKQKPDLLQSILAQAKAPFKDAAAINTTRWALNEAVSKLNLPVERSSGGRTKYNRTMRGLPKTHWIDAANVGASTPEDLQVAGVTPLLIRATGHNNRQMCRTNKYGFPVRHRKRQRRHFGYQTGDMIQAVVPSGKYSGVHVGRVAVRATGVFNVTTSSGKVLSISAKYCRHIHRADGYSYTRGA